MSPLAMVLALLAAAVVMFAINRPRMDAVAVIMIVLLPLTGVVTVPEALAGLADPNVLLIAAFFVIGEAMVRTGVAQRLGDWLTARAGASEPRLIGLLMLVVAGVGSVMSSTGVVAIFIPIVLRTARTSGIPAGRLMMPLSMAALISGMMTLVATATNLVVHAELIRQGHPGFGFFAFLPFGAPILGLAILYMLAARRFLAPGPAADAARRMTKRQCSSTGSIWGVLQTPSTCERLRIAGISFARQAVLDGGPRRSRIRVTVKAGWRSKTTSCRGGGGHQSRSTRICRRRCAALTRSGFVSVASRRARQSRTATTWPSLHGRDPIGRLQRSR